MLFNSVAFAIFLPIVFILYWALPHRFRWALILAASCYFYMSWNAKYIVLILFTTFLSYLAGRLLEKAGSLRQKKAILWGTLIACLGVLLFFKYFNFLSQSVTAVLGRLSIPVQPVTVKLLLPVGISFYTFQTLSYVIDVYRGSVPAEHHFGKYAAFISFFPQLVAGPIERTDNLLPQIKEERKFDYDQAAYGLKLMAWGFFKKVIIADNLSPYVQPVFDGPRAYHGFAFAVAALLFAIQIYCDFSGYSDIAIGTSKLLGIDLMTNFRSPYFSGSIKEFWSRWHISLSTWFRDYVYIPLGGNRVGKLRHYRNLLLTFLASGLWHGANWTYVIWGGLHGAAQILENALFPPKKANRAPWAIRVLFVFAFCVLTWIFFVSGSVGDAMYILGHLFDGITSPVSYLRAGFASIGLGVKSLLGLLPSLLLLTVYDFTALKRDPIALVSAQKKGVRWVIYVALVLWMILFVPVARSTEFIYFQF